MKRKSFCLAIIVLMMLPTDAQNVAINNDGTTPDSTAILDIKSNIKGVLIPRMNFTERFFLVKPATSLLVYQTDDYPNAPSGFYYNAGTPLQPAWKRITTGEKQLQQIFETSGSFIIPTGITKIYFEAVGGGGGRGGRSNYNAATLKYYFGGTGGGGAYTRGSINVYAGQTINIVIGQGGINGTDGTTTTNGNAGGNTTIAIGATIVLTAGGGSGGFAATNFAVGVQGNGGGPTYNPGYVNIERGIYGVNGNNGEGFEVVTPGEYGACGFTAVLGDYNYFIAQYVTLAGNSTSFFSCPYFGKGSGASNSTGGYVIISY